MTENDEKKISVIDELEQKRKEMEETRKKDLEELKQKFRKVRSIDFLVLLIDVISILICYLLIELNLWMPILWLKSLLWIIFFLSLIVLYLTKALKLIREFEKGLVERFRRYRRTEGPGIRLILYPFERLKFIRMWEQRIDIPPQEAITKDPITLKINAVIWFKIKIPYGAEYNIEDLHGSVLEIMKTGLRQEVADRNLETLLVSRSKISESLKNILSSAANKKNGKDKAKTEGKKIEVDVKKESRKSNFLIRFFRGGKVETDGWGVEFPRVEIQYIELPKDVEASLERKYAAGQDREAEIRRSEGEAKAVENVYVAIKTNDEEFQITNLKTLQEMSKNPAALIVPSKGLDLLSAVAASVGKAFKKGTLSERS